MRTTSMKWWAMADVPVFCMLAAPGARAAAPRALSPQQALARLAAGNQRFQSGAATRPDQDKHRREQLANGQAPFAVILSCSDSRVPPEIIFDQGFGDLFVVRVAGNTVTQAGRESIEYAVDYLGSALIMVLGHDSCGAVKGAVAECPRGGKEPPAKLAEIFRNICPAVEQARKAGGVNLESSAIDLNVAGQVRILKQYFKKQIEDGSLMVVGGRYNLATGKVRILPSPE